MIPVYEAYEPKVKMAFVFEGRACFTWNRCKYDVQISHETEAVSLGDSITKFKYYGLYLKDLEKNIGKIKVNLYGKISIKYGFGCIETINIQKDIKTLLDSPMLPKIPLSIKEVKFTENFAKFYNISKTQPREQGCYYILQDQYIKNFKPVDRIVGVLNITGEKPLEINVGINTLGDVLSYKNVNYYYDKSEDVYWKNGVLYSDYIVLKTK